LLEYPSLRPSKFKAFVRGLGAPRLMDLLDHPGKDTPAAWIRSSCGPDAVEQSEASRRKRGGRRARQIHGHKLSHFFAIDQERGTRPFTERDVRLRFVVHKDLEAREGRYRLRTVSNKVF
jgi:hypothetical protein